MSAQNWALFFLSPNFEDVEQIDIKDISGAILLTTLPNEGCKRKFTLMKEDYITLKFSLESPIFFKLGSCVECDFGLFEVCDLQKPVFNANTAGYDYELQLDAHYWKWKNKIFKYTPEVAGQEASWNLTASLDVQAGIVLRNLKALGYAYKGQDFVFSIDSTVENKALLMTYDNINILDACFSMAKKWDCECWVTENIIHFGRCESGDAVDFEIGKNVQEMPQSESQSTYATRIYAFGSTKNIPSDYRPVDETVVLNGVVQKRLMLPEGTPYIDAYPDMTTEEAIEQVVIFDDVYPRRVGTMSDITIKEYTDKIENADGTTTEKKWNAYRFKDTGITFSKDYILPGKELKITVQSGKLNGMEFAVTFDPEGKPEKLGNGGWNPEAQLWEIVRNEDYGRPLPDGVLIPENGDTYILSGWNPMKIAEMGLVAEAQLELKDKADKYVAKSKIDPSTYNCKMMSDVAYSEDGIHNLYSIGQKVNLINKAYFENGRQSRIIGFEFNLDLPYDSPIYTVGETAAYSRIGELEEKLESLTLKGQTYTGSGSSGVYVIRRNDSTPATDSNVFSALRSLAMFLRKDRADGTPFPITFGDWVKFGEFLTGISGGCIDKNGILEMEEGIFRKRLFVPEIAYNRVTYFKGRMCASPGGGCTVKEWSDNGDGSYTITPDLTDADGLSQFVDDILTTYFVTKNAEGKLQGFEEMKFRVTSADYTAKTFVMTPKPGTDWKPGDAMVLAQTGNFTDEDRQTYILIDTVNGNNCITFFDHANTWDVEPAQEMSWIGKKKGRTVHGIPADNYSAVFRHVIMSGKIFQVDDITGEAFRVPLFKGTWKKGEKCAYYDEVTHNGSSWICVNEKGTSTEPADGNADWLKYAAKGESGKGIKSTDVEYAISMSNVIAPVDGWQTTSPEWEAGKYIWSRTKIVYSDDEVKYTQAACISGGQGADGKGIKSITEEYYLSSSSATTTGGEWQTTSPAWKNGWYIWTRTRIVFTDDTSTTTNAICVTGSKGADGTSITNCGDWQTSKHIPYMGITKMAGRVFLCVAPDGTDNPPMWTQTTNEGRRILQTQNGGKSYGYTITGDLNTAEYELLVENGQDGKDGRDYEWIFKHTTENVTPPTPATSQVDDYVPSGWHDDPIGVSESLPYEWACCRTKKDGVWSAFSPAAIWAKWGFDGESAIVADFDNEMESIALTYEGKTVSQSVLNTTVGMWYGTKKLQLKSISCVTPAGVTESYNVNTGVIAFTVASGISMPARSEVRITVTATVQDTDISRELVFTIAGVRAGNPGSDAVLYRLVPSISSVSKRKDGTYSVASVSCTRTKSVGGSTSITTDGVLKYSKDGGAEVEIQNGTAISPKNFTAQLQFVFYVGGQVVDRETIPMVVDGNDGNPGKPGGDGESAIVADFDNEMESIALTYEGKTVSQSVLNTTVGMWYGTKKLQLKSISCVTPAGVTESYNVNTGVIAFTVASGISMPARSEVRITVTATVQDTDISRELVFTIAGVRAGNPGSDAVLYRLVPSISSVSKRKDGTYSVASVSCTRTKSVGGSTSITTDGVLKYSKDGGAEVELNNGTAISPKNFTTQLQFVFYVGGQVVDRETIPMVVDGTDGNPGKPGGDGESVKAGGEWRTANTPYKKLTICTMGGRSWLSKVDTSNPPLWTQTTHDGRRITQTQNGGKSYGYIITEEVNTDEWEQLTSDGGMVYLISTCSNIRVSNAGSLVPSAFRVYAKRTLGSATLTYPDGYLAARGYSNGIWSAIAGPSRASEITVNASAGYSTFSVRCYQSQADASAWNDSFIAEISVGVSYDGASGRDASEPRPRGFFTKGNTYVWNEDYHDIVLATFNNRTIPFRVRAYGTSVTVAPTSIDGDANWEAAQQYMFVAMDMALARKIRADEILVDDLVVQNVLARDKTGKAMCQIDGENGGIGFLAGGNIRWDAKGNVFQDASIFRKLKLLESKSDSNEYYLDFNTGLNFEISRIFSLPTQEETIYLPNAAEYEGGECMLYNGGIYTRLTGPASIKVAGGGSFIIDGEYYSKIVVPSLSIAQFKAVATYSDGVKDEVKWVLISGKAESKI